MSFCMTLRIGSDSCLQIRKISINIIDLQFHLSCTKASTCSLAKLQVIPASISRSTHRFIGSPTGEFCIAASVESPCNFDRMAMGSGGSKKRPIFSRKLSPCSFRKYIYIYTCRDFGKPIKLGGFPWCLGVDGRSPIPFAHLQTLNLEPIGSKKSRGQPGGRRFPPVKFVRHGFDGLHECHRFFRHSRSEWLERLWRWLDWMLQTRCEATWKC